MIGKYHKLFTERKNFTGDTPEIVNIGEWDEGDEEDKQRAPDKRGLNRAYLKIFRWAFLILIEILFY